MMMENTHSPATDMKALESLWLEASRYRNLMRDANPQAFYRLHALARWDLEDHARDIEGLT